MIIEGLFSLVCSAIAMLPFDWRKHQRYTAAIPDLFTTSTEKWHRGRKQKKILDVISFCVLGSAESCRGKHLIFRMADGTAVHYLHLLLM